MLCNIIQVLKLTLPYYQAAHAEAPREHHDDPAPAAMSGIKKFFIGLLVSSPRFSDKTFTLNSYFQVVLGVIVCVVVGIMIYQNQQENSRKRFY